MTRGSTIVVIDDSAEILELLDVVLTDEGFRVVSCCQVDEALATVAAERPELVIADLVMAGLPRWELIEALLADPRTADTPVIVCSGATYELQHARNRLPTGRCEVLVKPFAIDALMEMIQRLLRGAEHA
jgi:DNA-binding response OmpR family regulator